MNVYNEKDLHRTVSNISTDPVSVSIRELAENEFDLVSGGEVVITCDAGSCQVVIR